MIMNELLNEYNYSRQFILVENQNKKIRKKIKSEVDLMDIDDYLWKIITTISIQNIGGITYHLIQYEDKQLGWINLEDSIQIYRFPAKHYKIIEERFSNNEINSKMNIEKDFISHFKGKLLNIKSKIFYENEIYYSVFIKNKFHGFHHYSVLDPIRECDIEIAVEQLDENTQLYKVSNLTKPVEGEYNIESIKLISVFKEIGVGKVLLNQQDNFWIYLDNIDGLNLDFTDEVQKSVEELQLDDIFYSVNSERNKSKEILKTVLSAKDFLNNNKNKSISSDQLRNSSFEDEELKKHYNELKKEKLEQDKNFRKTDGELKLAQKRLEHQKDYTNRLEAQRDKYKKRMVTVEEKLKNLDTKYKSLKEQLNKK